MLSRRFIRTKVFQAIFAYRLSGNKDVAQARKDLLESVEKLHQLFIYQLSLLPALGDFAKKKIEENKRKHLPTFADLHPNTRFVDNRVTKLLKNNIDLRYAQKKYGIDWSRHEDLLRKLFAVIQESKTYKEYLNSEDSFENDKNVWIKIIKNHLYNFTLLKDLYEDMESVWGEDIITINSLIIKFIKSLNSDDDDFKKLPGLFYTDGATGTSPDKEFMLELFDKTIEHTDENKKLIESKVVNWDIERIPLTDMVILEMALTEILHFPTIPLKVTLNEYIELSKKFSIPNNHIFVNGILDRLIAQLLKEGKIKKEGRGLIDSSTRRAETSS